MKNNQVAVSIFSTLKRHKLLSAGVLVTVAGAIIASLLPPLVLADIIDKLTAGEGISFVKAVLYFALLALTGVLESGRESLLTVIGQKITHALRSSLVEKVNKLSADSLNKQDPGTVVSRFIGDVDTVENLFTSGIVSMFADACKIISIFVIILTKSTGLAIILLIVMPIIYVFTRKVQKSMLVAQSQNRAAIGKVTGHVPETIRCIRMIHTLNKEEYMKKEYDRLIGESYRAVEKTNFYDSIYSPVILISNAVIVALVMILSASGNALVLTFFGMSVGTAVAAINYISQIFSPIESLGMEIQTIQSAVAGVYRINEFLNLPERWQANEDVNAEENVSICLDHVRFGYDSEHIILDNVSFTVNAGEHVTLVGRTGAGKSTILRLLMGLYQPMEGSVRVKGTEASLIRDGKRSIFGYVEQTFHMVPGNIRDQITLFDSNITDEMTENAAKLVGLHEIICAFENGYDTLCTRQMFSQGQWQLLAIARAIAADPEILLLDEITANLDAVTESNVLTAISNASAGRTVISISHRIWQQAGGRVITIGE